MSKYDVCSFLCPNDSSELFEIISKTLAKHQQVFISLFIPNIEIKGTTEEEIAQNFMDKAAVGFKEDENV